MQSFPHTGLYAIIDDTIHKEYGLVRLLTEIVRESTIPVVQFRFKKMSQNQKRDFITKISDLKKIRPITFIMNDDLDFLDMAKIDGVHLGQKDAIFGRAQRPAPTKIFGLSTHNLHEAKLAMEAGANYIGCGSVFSTKSKNDTTPLGLEGLRKIVDGVAIPTVAIGGINFNNIAQVAKTGCTMAAVISGLIEEGEFVGQKLHEMFLHNSPGPQKLGPPSLTLREGDSVLLIGGIDPTGHAGLYRDQEICHQLATPCLSISTALALQSDQKYWQTLPVPTKTLRKILDDIDVKMIGAVKIGMLVNQKTVTEVVRFIHLVKKQNPKIKVVWDPVFKSSSGGLLLNKAGQKLAIQNLWPLVDLITPNAIEAKILSQNKNPHDWRKLAETLYRKNHVAVYLKGGHTAQKATDYFYDGAPQIVSGPVFKTKPRGTGCTFATAAACTLIKENSLLKACFQAKNTINRLFFK